MMENQLSIHSIQGTSSRTSSHFDIQGDLICYTASGGVVVSRIDHNKVSSQRFFVASTSPSSHPENSYIDDDIKKDSFGYPINSPIVVNGTSANLNSENEALSPLSPAKSPSKSTLKDRVRSINCLALSPNKKLLAVGETGYLPRILIFSLAPNSSNAPVVIINDHSFGISHVKFSEDGKFLCSLGVVNDGVINIWKTSGSFQLLCTNRCSSIINDIIWYQGYLITLGVRVIKIWTIEEGKKSTIKGKNVILGSFLNNNFLSGSVLNTEEILIVANDNKLLVLALGEGFKLVELQPPKFDIISVFVSNGKIWFCSKDYEINHLTIDDLIIEANGTQSLELNKLEPSYPVKLLAYNDNLLYLSGKGSLDLYNMSSLISTTLINSLYKGLIGVRSVEDKLYLYNGKGEVSCNNDTILKFDVPTSDVLDNAITSMAVNHELILGDKFGYLYVFTKSKDDKYEKSFQVKAHESSITDIITFTLNDFEYLVSISRDRMIQIFQKSNEWSLLQTIPLHTGNLLKVEYWNERIYVCSSDRTVSIHHITDRAKLEKNIPLKTSPVMMKHINNELIISTIDKNLLIYNLKTLESRTLKLFNNFNESLLVENFLIHKSTIFVSSSDKSLRSFNYQTGKLLTTNYGHSDSIIYLGINDEKLITIGSDGCLFNWNLVADAEPFKSVDFSPIDNDSPKVLSPLHAKVMRKIIPTSPTREPKSPTRERDRERERPLSPTRNSFNSLSPSPSPRLTAATIKRMERSRSVSPVRSPSKPLVSKPTRPLSMELSKNTTLPPTVPTTINNSTNSITVKGIDQILSQLTTLKSSINKNNFNADDKQKIINELLGILEILGYEDNKEILHDYSDKLVNLFKSKLNI